VPVRDTTANLLLALGTHACQAHSSNNAFVVCEQRLEWHAVCQRTQMHVSIQASAQIVSGPNYGPHQYAIACSVAAVVATCM
jgi:hypothetical protein